MEQDWTPETLAQHISARCNGTCILAFSRGKDSLAAWLHLRKYFKTIIPFNTYFVPDLQFELDSLKYYEDFFQTRIRRYPDPHMYEMLNAGCFQTRKSYNVILDMGLPNFDMHFVADCCRRDAGLPVGTFVAYGMSAMDSIARRTMIKQRGPMNDNRKSFYPLFNAKIGDILSIIRESGVKLPKDYNVMRRSFNGIECRTLVPVRDNWPEDYQQILRFFPLADIQIERQVLRRKHLGKV